jgi:hypothetical protein
LQEGSTSVGEAFGTAGGRVTAESALWVAFWSLLIGAVLAALGGLLGGKMRRPVVELKRSSRRGAKDPGVAEAAPAPATEVTMTENYVVDQEPVDRTAETSVDREDAARRR